MTDLVPILQNATVTQDMLADCIRIVVGIFPNFLQNANSLNSKTENNYQNNLLKYIYISGLVQLQFV